MLAPILITRPSRRGNVCTGAALRNLAGLLSLAALAALCLTACQKSNLLDVSGAVTLDGAPLADGTIQFQPADGKGPSAGANILDGQYRVKVTAGEKKVQILGFKTIGEKRYIENDPSTPMVPIKKPIVPKKYNEESTLVSSIAPDKVEQNFELHTEPAAD